VTSSPVGVARWGRPEGTTLRLVLVRHGEPEASARGRCYGRLDVDLSMRGRQQMRRVARLLESAPLAAVYCSPRRRARESGEILAAPHGLAPRPENRFREIDFGSLEGLTYDEAAERFPEVYKAWMERPTEVEFPGGESLSAMRGRVVAAAGELMGRHGGHTIAIVSHGGGPHPSGGSLEPGRPSSERLTERDPRQPVATSRGCPRLSDPTRRPFVVPWHSDSPT
jgi:broad specificity phosphatase PhoE